MGEAIKKVKFSEWVMVVGCIFSVGIFYNRTDTIEKNQVKCENEIKTLVEQIDVKDEKDRQYAYNQAYANRQKIERMATENKQWREEFIEVKVELRGVREGQKEQTRLLQQLIKTKEFVR